tara:strand:- start:95 stop:502 length:408 start_codon:yes stop_codon:yes gene_type:complete
MIQTLIPQIAPILGNVLDRFFPDKEKAAQAQRAIESALLENAAQINLAQIEVNKAEAQHRTIFVAGWRPFIGWVCGVALAWHFVGVPVALFFIAWYGAEVPELPVFDMNSLMTVLMGMLGLGGLRTFEKMKGLTQ